MSTQVTLLGRIGQEPDVRFGQSGKAVVKFSLVTNGRRQVDGAWVDVDTTWWSVVAFGKLAETIADSVHKGQAVIVVGDVKQVEWEKDGQKRVALEVTARTVGVDLRFASPKVERESVAAQDMWESDPVLPQAEAAPF